MGNFAILNVPFSYDIFHCMNLWMGNYQEMRIILGYKLITSANYLGSAFMIAIYHPFTLVRVSYTVELESF